jgi:hypothetical protein
MQEIWKDINGYGGLYQISNYGNVKSVFNDKILKPFLAGNKIKYNNVTLCNNKVRERVRNHRLVAEHFIDNPLNREQVKHIDGNPLNNHVSNLEWSSSREIQSNRFLSSGNKTSKYVGVYFSGKKWRADIKIKGKKIALGSFDTEEEAYVARVKYTNDNNIFDKYL